MPLPCHHPERVPHLLAWEPERVLTGCSNILDDNMLGGQNVGARPIADIFGCESGKQECIATEVLKPTWKTVVKFVGKILLPCFINTYAIVSRWDERPPRDPEEFQNWSKLALAHMEFAGLVFFVSHIFGAAAGFVVQPLLADKWTQSKGGATGTGLGLSGTRYLVLLISYGLFLYLFATCFSIVSEELGIAFHDDASGSGQDSTGDSIGLFGNVSRDALATYGRLEGRINALEDLGPSFFIVVFTFGFTVVTRGDFCRLNNFKKTVSGERGVSGLHYDPRTVHQVADALQNISSFSLLQVVSWTRHKLPNHVSRLVSMLTSTNLGAKSGYILVPLGYILVPLSFCLVLPGLLSLTIKMKQVQFVGEVEFLDWSHSQQIQFLAFLNNILALDTGEKQDLSTVLTFLFGGNDGVEQTAEKFTENTFMNMIAAHVTHESGLWAALVVVPQIGHQELQKLCIKEKDGAKQEEVETSPKVWLTQPPQSLGFSTDGRRILKGLSRSCSVRSHRRLWG